MEIQFDFTISILGYFFNVGFSSCCDSGCVSSSSIQSSERVISLHWMALGTTVFDLESSIWRSRVSPFCDWNLCSLAKAVNIAL